MKWSIFLCVTFGVIQVYRCLDQIQPHAERPGFRGRVTKKGLDYGTTLAIDMLMAHLINMEPPPITTNVAGSQVNIFNTVIHYLMRPTVELTLIPDYGISINISDISIIATANYSYDANFGFFTIEYEGVIKVNVANNMFSMVLMIGSNELTGKPKLLESACYSDGEIDILFEGGGSSFLNLGTSLLQSTVQSLATSMVCQKLEDQLNNEEDQLEESARYTVAGSFGKDFSFDFRLVGIPKFTNEYLQTSHKGSTYYVYNPKETPLEPSIIPEFPDHTNKMVYMYVTDYVINSGLFAGFEAGKYKYHWDKSLIPNDINKGLLELECEENEICLGSLFPSLTRRTSDSITIEVEATSPPAVHFVGGQTASLDVSGEAAVVLGHGRRKSKTILFTVKFNLLGSLKFRVYNGVVSFELVNISKFIHMNDIDDIHPQKRLLLSNKVIDAVDLALSVYAIPNLKAFGEKGFPLPRDQNVAFKDMELMPLSIPGLLVVASDFVISLPCNITIGNITSAVAEELCSNGSIHIQKQSEKSDTPLKDLNRISVTALPSSGTSATQNNNKDHKEESKHHDEEKDKDKKRREKKQGRAEKQRKKDEREKLKVARQEKRRQLKEERKQKRKALCDERQKHKELLKAKRRREKNTKY